MGMLSRATERLAAAMKPLPTSSYGYPERTAEELGLTEYFRANTNVAGMAWGGGLNGSAKDEPRVVVVNPFNPNMANPTAHQGLLKLEASRHLMDEQGYVPQFEITPMQQEWRKKLGVYATNDTAFKQSLISRLIVNDNVPGAPGVKVAEGATAEQLKASQDIMQQLTAKTRGAVQPVNPEQPKFKGFPSSHPFVTNKDGSKSNVKLATVGIGNKTFVIPTMVEGKDLPVKKAVKTAIDYGLTNYPSFSNPQDAESWSEKYHGSIDEKGRVVNPHN